MFAALHTMSLSTHALYLRTPSVAERANCLQPAFTALGGCCTEPAGGTSVGSESERVSDQALHSLLLAHQRLQTKWEDVPFVCSNAPRRVQWQW